MESPPRDVPAEERRWDAYEYGRSEAIMSAPYLRHGLRLGRFPSFEAQYCWTVEHRPGRGQPPIATLVICDIKADRSNFFAASAIEQSAWRPQLSKRATCELSPAVLEEFDSILAATTLTLAVPAAPVGVDGTVFRLRQRAGLCEINVEWWAKAPASWSGLESAFHALWRRLTTLAGLSSDS